MKPALSKTLRSLCVGTAALLIAAHASASTAIEQFQSFVSSTKSAKGEFTQRQIKKIENQSVLSQPASGFFVFAKPGRFIWKYNTPYEQVLQADGKKLYIFDKDLNQVTIRKLNGSLDSNPAAILFGSSDINKSFTIKEVGAKKGIDWLEAIPKSNDTGFEKIGIGMKDGLPVAMELQDSFGQISLVTFIRFEQNPLVSKAIFKFEIPEGADVFSQ